MATATTEIARPPEASTAEACLRPYRITVALYERIVESGILDKEPVFLWRGQIVEKMTKGHKHNLAAAGMTELLVKIVPPDWHVRVEQPVVIPDDGAPEPDFSVVRGRARDYRDRDVTAHDVALLIEVADSSLGVDSGEVLEDYARQAIPIYWIVNIPGRTIDVYTKPTGPRASGPPFYSERQSFRPDEDVPVVLDSHEVGRINVRDILP